MSALRRISPTPLLAGLVALASLIRFSTLDRQSFWSDEAVTALLVRMGAGEMLSTTAETESTPPLYYALAWAWAQGFGSGEIGLRSLSATAGVVAVPLAYAAGATWLDRRAGLVAAALVAVHPLLVWYAQEARAYALLMPLGLLSLWMLGRARARPSAGSTAAWAASAVALLATHYFALFLVLAEAGLLLLVGKGSRAARYAVGGVAVAAAALAPLALAQRSRGSADYIADDALHARLANLGKQFLVGRDAPLDQLLAVVVAGLVVAVAVVALRSRPSPRSPRPLVVIALVALAAPVALALVGLDYVTTQNALVVAAPLVLVVAAAIARAGVVGLCALGALTAIGVFLVVAVALRPAYHRTDWRGAAAGATLGGGEIVVAAPDYDGWFARVPLQVYLPSVTSIDEGLAEQSPQHRRLGGDAEARATDPVSVEEIVVLALGAEDRRPEVELALPPRFSLVEERDDGAWLIRRFRGPAASSRAVDLVRHGPDDVAVAVLRARD